ncbi:MAG: 7TM domain-containing protein [Planctomycetota bacterium]|jgi:D-alanine-D-alanine ligase
MRWNARRPPGPAQDAPGAPAAEIVALRPQHAEPDNHPAARVSLFRPKGNLRLGHAWMLSLLVVFATALTLGRMSWAPTAEMLGRFVSLTNLPPSMLERVSYLLFVPVGALVVVLVRLTLGIRLLGPFRSILLAIAFQITGVTLGLLFLAAVIAAIVLLRPHLKQMGLPYFGRVSVILGAVSGLMVGAVLVASSLGLDHLQRIVYFPIVVLCLAGDGFAIKLNKEGPASALWRGATTAGVAVLITWLSNIPSFDLFLLSFPELIIHLVVWMIVISEHFDLRLLAWLNPAVPEEDEQPRQPTRADTGSSADDNADSDVWLSASPVAALRLPATGLKVAVVCNRTNEGIIAQLGAPCPERYGERSVQRVAQALRGAGHTVGIFEADMTLLERLRVFLGAGGSSGLGGIVFNMSYGIQGESRYTHVPAMLEMAGVPYTGPGPLGHAVSLDKVVAKVLMRHAGVPTPAFAVMRGGEVGEGDLRFPLVVKPRHESTSNGLHVVGDAEELAEAVEDVRQRYTEDALVETFVSGREFAIGLLGNEPVECLPAVELEYPLGRLRAMTRDDKFHKRPDEPRKVCPPLAPAMKARLETLAVATFHACSCRDYARVDIRTDEQGRPFVLEINSMASLGATSSLVFAARHAGFDHDALVCRIVEIAVERYAARSPSPEGAPRLAPLEPAVVAAL